MLIVTIQVTISFQMDSLHNETLSYNVFIPKISIEVFVSFGKSLGPLIYFKVNNFKRLIKVSKLLFKIFIKLCQNV